MRNREAKTSKRESSGKQCGNGGENSAGVYTVSNQGFFFIQILDRQLEWGTGKYRGRYLEKDRTVSVRVFFFSLPR